MSESRHSELSGLRIAIIVRGRLEGEGAGRSGGYVYDRRLVEHWRSLGARVEALDSAPGRGVVSADFDLVVEDELCYPELMQRGLAFGGPPRVAIVHNLVHEFHRSATANLAASAGIEADYLSGVQGIIVNSRHTRLCVESALGSSDVPMCTAYPYLGPCIEAHIAKSPALGPRARPVGPLKCVTVGHLSRLKGLEKLVAALARAPHAIDCELVGGLDRDPGYVAELRAQVERAGLTRRVRFCGELAGPQLVRAFERAELMILPSPREGFGIAYLEAMAMGLAVLASREGAAPELIDDGRSGFLFDPTLEDDLEVGLERCWAARTRLPEMGSTARQRFEQAPDWQRAGQLSADFLLRVLAETRAADRAR